MMHPGSGDPERFAAVFDEFCHDIGLCATHGGADLAGTAASLGARGLMGRHRVLGGIAGGAAALSAARVLRNCAHPRVAAAQHLGSGDAWAYAIDAAWGIERLAANLALLAARMRAYACRMRYSPEDRQNGVVWVLVMAHDPLAQIVGGSVPPPAPADLTSILLGRTEMGDHALIPLKDRNGAVYGAESGGGKTFTINAMLAGWAQHPSVQLAIIDGKAGADYVWAEPRAQVCLQTTDRQAAVEALAPYVDELNRRTGYFRDRFDEWRSAGAIKGEEPPTSFWHAPPIPDMPLLVVVIDEAQGFLTGAKTKDEKQHEGEFTQIVADLMNRGRSAGIFTLCATQKPTTDSMPSVIRDKAAMRIVGRLSTAEAVRAALGRAVVDGEPDPQMLPQKPGMVILAPEAGDLVTARSWYVDPGDLVRLGVQVAHLRRPLPEE